jgi:hypothetical protein
MPGERVPRAHPRSSIRSAMAAYLREPRIPTLQRPRAGVPSRPNAIALLEFLTGSASTKVPGPGAMETAATATTRRFQSPHPLPKKERAVFALLSRSLRRFPGLLAPCTSGSWARCCSGCSSTHSLCCVGPRSRRMVGDPGSSRVPCTQRSVHPRIRHGSRRCRTGRPPRCCWRSPRVGRPKGPWRRPRKNRYESSRGHSLSFSLRFSWQVFLSA